MHKKISVVGTLLVTIISLGGLVYCNNNSNSPYVQDIFAEDYLSFDTATDIQLIDYSDSETAGDNVIHADINFAEEPEGSDALSYPDGLVDIVEDTGIIPDLTPELVGYESKDLPVSGSYIFFNNWSMTDTRDSIEMISPDGSYRGIRMYAYRVWSFGINQNGNIIVFSTNDPFQYERYGLNIYDAIQNSWLIKGASIPVQISFGPVNDECHNFISDDSLMMCRRANFRPDPQYMAVSDPYRILIHSLTDHQEKFITPLDTKYNDYYGNMRPDGLVIFNRNIIAERKIDIMLLDPANEDISLFFENANSPVLSPDGSEMLFRKKGENKIYLSSSYNPENVIAVVDGGSRAIGRYVFSPDGKQIAYMLEDRTNNCSDLMVVGRDGSGQKKILDCSDEKKFITVIKWIEVK